MKELINESIFLGVFLTLFGYQLGSWLKTKYKLAIFNPLIIGTIFVMGSITILNIDSVTYQADTQYISYFLTPATICLALPLYDKWNVFKQHYQAVLTGIGVGVIVNLITIYILSLCFQFTHIEYVTLLPKSITTAIGMDVSNQMGGIISITAFSIIVTGVFGAIVAPILFKVANIHMPIARGVALGTSSHAIGTTKAMELGEVEAAMSSLSIVLTGVLTIIGVTLFQFFI